MVHADVCSSRYDRHIGVEYSNSIYDLLKTTTVDVPVLLGTNRDEGTIFTYSYYASGIVNTAAKYAIWLNSTFFTDSGNSMGIKSVYSKEAFAALIAMCVLNPPSSTGSQVDSSVHSLESASSYPCQSVLTHELPLMMSSRYFRYPPDLAPGYAANIKQTSAALRDASFYCGTSHAAGSLAAGKKHYLTGGILVKPRTKMGEKGCTLHTAP